MAVVAVVAEAWQPAWRPICCFAESFAEHHRRAHRSRVGHFCHTALLGAFALDEKLGRLTTRYFLFLFLFCRTSPYSGVATRGPFQQQKGRSSKAVTFGWIGSPFHRSKSRSLTTHFALHVQTGTWTPTHARTESKRPIRLLTVDTGHCILVASDSKMRRTISQRQVLNYWTRNKKLCTQRRANASLCQKQCQERSHILAKSR